MALAGAYNSQVRPLLDAVDRVREILDGGDEQIELPQIAVVGNQSAGKTSVLERLSGIDLPRGDGMVTRCALVLRMVATPGAKPYAVIKGGKEGPAAKNEGEKITLGDVARRVTEITDSLVGPDDVCDDTISLSVFSPEVPDLTLIDLPGIIYTDGEGKKSDIADRIKALYMRHISKAGCIILCALPANVDPGTQEVKAWASEVDQLGERTLGVVTKIDRADETDMTLGTRLLGNGRNAWAFKLGAVAMRNRTQDELEKGASRADVDAAERSFFARHSALVALSDVDKARVLGAKALVERLTVIQAEAVRSELPRIIKQVAACHAATAAKLAALPAAFATEAECMDAFVSLTTKLQQCVAEVAVANYSNIHAFAAVRGAVVTAEEAGGDAYPVEVNALHLMPRLEELFNTFLNDVSSNALIFSEPYAKTIAAAMKESAGCELPDKVNTVVFGRLVAKVVSAMRAPACELLDNVLSCTTNFCETLREELFASFPALNLICGASIDDFLQASFDRCRAHVEEQLKLESEAYTLNADFVRMVNFVVEWKAKRAKEAAADANYHVEPWCDATIHKVCSGQNIRVVYHVTADGKAVTNENPYIPRPVGTLDGSDSLSAAVLDAQLRLFCYRKLEHKRFVDQVACYVRLHFPRALRDNLARHLRKAVITQPSDEEGGEPMTLMSLMAEPPWQNAERARLKASIERLSKAEKELKRGGLHALVGGGEAKGAPVPARAHTVAHKNKK